MGLKGAIVARQRLIDPKPVSVGAALRQGLEAQGVAQQDADWLAPALLDIDGVAEDQPLSEGPDQGVLLDVMVPELGKALLAADGALNAGVIVLLDIMALNRLPPPRERPNAEQKQAVENLRRFVERCRVHGVQMAEGFLLAMPQRRNADSAWPLWFARRMLACRAISPAELINIETVLALGDQPDWSDFQRSYGNRTDHTSEPTTLPFWLEIAGPSAIEPLLATGATLPDDQFIRLARGIAYALGVWPRVERHSHPEFFAERGDAFAEVARKIFEEADRRFVNNKESEELRYVWMRFAWMASDASDEWIADDRRKRLLKVAADDIGRLRPILRRAAPEDAKAVERLDPHIRSCIFVLFILGSLWEATKPLLLAFRALGTRAVGSDLRYWNTSKPDDPPTPWERFPRSLMNLLHHHMGDEQETDAELDGLRTQFASFCLDRLKTRQRRAAPPITEEDLIESDPAWREGFIQAARALRVNPGGKGHRILHWTSQHDPDEAVRELAAKAYTELRHQPRLPQGLSPRRTVFDAFWWLRQAHLSSLGEPIDEAGASRTREQEARRTTEAESE
ncbi:MAG: hypothetical protein ACF8R9_12695 [Phycisphaerales bacterium JB054]